ncbi:LysR family transcriptional regulator [Acinetobacter haemolyticus]|uniref:LysR family transcriptional regulator n=1 Tax=Acinetobacter haemolyticus TaxID=29430 RepID=A0AAW4JHD8_ACIHA|nr:LysR family transcriptional regulator [Acinetobacter haemolyticus]MBO3659293.1 LysR family transcriptional regulator [Acinetobacter haemolyticus]
MKENLNDLHVFMIVAEEKSFTRAAARMSTSQSAISQTIRNLEARIGIKLLSRTTRSVSLTQAGEYLLKLIQPAIQEIEQGIHQLSALKENPAGTLRINADEYAIQSVLWPAVEKLLNQYSDIHVEISADYGLIDIVDARFDAGLRRGGLVSKNMIAVQISPPTPMLVVATPQYFKKYGKPKIPNDLLEHSCIHLRLPTHGALFKWKFSQAGKTQTVNLDSRIIFTSLAPILQAVRSGIGIAHLPIDMVKADIEKGELEEALSDWRHIYEPYYLYYPHRREQAPLLNILVKVLREQFESF